MTCRDLYVKLVNEESVPETNQVCINPCNPCLSRGRFTRSNYLPWTEGDTLRQSSEDGTLAEDKNTVVTDY